jgi:hypothetical protein
MKKDSENFFVEENFLAELFPPFGYEVKKNGLGYDLL